MTDPLVASATRDASLDTFVAELTEAAYRVALRHGAGDNWLQLQLDLRAELTQAVANRI